MSQTRNYLFREHDSFGVKRATTQAMLEEITRYDGNRLLNTNTDDLVNYFVDKHKIDIPVLLEDQMQLDAQESNRDVSRRSDYGFEKGPVIVAGTHITLEVPFTGDPDLFKIQPSTHSMPPVGIVRGQILIFEYWSESPDPDQFTVVKDKWLVEIKQYLQWHHQTFDEFNQSLPALAREAIEARKQKLLSSQNMVASLGIPLKRSSNPPQTFSAPEVKRKIVQPPPSSKGAYVAEPILEENEYQNILGIMDNMVHVMERSPKDFHNMGEETLRSHFLVQLNSQYEGKASAETFNYEGKTDILIRSGDKNIFIAECKFWGGQKMLTETIDQILGYLTWRDSKAAILIFNRNKDFSKVLDTIPSTVQAHPNCKTQESQSRTRFRYTFRHKNDAAKLLHLTVIAYDIPTY